MITASAKELRDIAKSFTNLVKRNYQPNYARRYYELAAALCIAHAEQMERGEQSFEEWLDEYDNNLSHCPCGSCDMKRAWHAAQAQMQAKVDNAASVTNSFKEQLLAAKAKLDAAGALLDAAARNVDVKVIESLQRELDAANERVKEITAVKDGADTHVESLEQAQAALCAALATAEHERDLLCGEVRRMERLIKSIGDPRYVEGELNNRPAEVRALVECVGPSGATG